MEISPDHPRYRSLVIRERMSALVKEGIVAPTGLIAHGRGEAFDYLLGERTTPEAEEAERAAAALLLEAKRPVITVNGNAAGLAAVELIALAAKVQAKLEVNLFHRTPERMEKVCRFMEDAGARNILGRVQDSRLVGIASDRALCSTEGIFKADVVLIPLEDGDRADALVKAGKKVIAIDLNPLSRTAMAADISIVDEVTRALPLIGRHAIDLADRPEERGSILSAYDNRAILMRSRKTMCSNLGSMA